MRRRNRFKVTILRNMRVGRIKVTVSLDLGSLLSQGHGYKGIGRVRVAVLWVLGDVCRTKVIVFMCGK